MNIEQERKAFEQWASMEYGWLPGIYSIHSERGTYLNLMVDNTFCIFRAGLRAAQPLPVEALSAIEAGAAAMEMMAEYGIDAAATLRGSGYGPLAENTAANIELVREGARWLRALLPKEQDNG